MDIEFRRARPDEFPAIAELDGANFGLTYNEQDLADARLEIDPERVTVAMDGARIVAVSAHRPLSMTVPGGEVAAMGITWASVEVTHRRRGLLRTIIERQLREQAEGGYAAGVLTASQAGIYGRYGFGVATLKRRVVVHRAGARLAVPVDTSAVQRLTTEQALPVLPVLHERWRRVVPGALSRDERRWQLLALDREQQRGGYSGLLHLVHPDGYMSYRLKHADDAYGGAEPVLHCSVVDYAPVTPEAHAALWQSLLNLDLVDSVESTRIPLDDPLPHLITDWRRVATTYLGDGMWLRPVNVCELLGARNYAVEVETVIEVADSLLGDGRYWVRGGPDGGSCERTRREPDIVLDAAALGAVSLGGTRLATLARAGRAGGEPRAVTRLDRALIGDRQPFHGAHI